MTAEISGPMPSPGSTQTRRAAALAETARRPGVADFDVDDKEEEEVRRMTTGTVRLAAAAPAVVAAAPPARAVTAAKRMII